MSPRILIWGGDNEYIFSCKIRVRADQVFTSLPTPNMAKIQAREIMLCENSSSIPIPEALAATTVAQRGTAIVLRDR